MGFSLSPCPDSFKPIQHYLKAAVEHESRDIVIVYWCRLYSLQKGLMIDKKSEEARHFLGDLLSWLESTKKDHLDNEAITNEIVAQAHVENYALKLFSWAAAQDEAEIYNKNVVKAFYTAGIIMDVLHAFGDLSDEIESKCKYAKWKAAYIHNCLKNGEAPLPGPVGFEKPDDFLDEGSSYNDKPGSSDMGRPGPSGSVFQPGETSPYPSSQPFMPSSYTSPDEIENSTPSIGGEQVQPSNHTLPAPDVTSTRTYLPEKGAKLEAVQISKAQKYCKFAASALNYDDVPEAINNLQKALHLLTTGQD